MVPNDKSFIENDIHRGISYLKFVSLLFDIVQRNECRMDVLGKYGPGSQTTNWEKILKREDKDIFVNGLETRNSCSFLTN